MKTKIRLFALVAAVLAIIFLSGCVAKQPDIMNIDVYEAETEIVYVDKEVVVIETQIEYVEVIIYSDEPGPPLEAANHQYYVDWIETYEDILDDFVDEMYRQWDDAYDLAYDYNRYLQAKLDNGESLNVDEVDFMMEFVQLDYSIAAFYTWVDEEIEPLYFNHLDTFPENPEPAEGETE